MLVIHPKDYTTAFLSALYDGVENTVVINDNRSRANFNHVLHHTPQNDRIMLLGHGSDKGLLWREDDTVPGFDGVLIGHPHIYHLRNHGSNIVAVFCNADKFAMAEHLHGLFTGMIISEIDEAVEQGVNSTEEEIELENRKFASRLRSLLDEAVPLYEIPRRMLELDDSHTPLTEFNYHRIYYL